MADSKPDMSLSGSIAIAEMPIPYGSPISLENAKKVAAAAIAEARKNNWTMAVAVTDTAGYLVYFERVDATPVTCCVRRELRTGC